MADRDTYSYVRTRSPPPPARRRRSLSQEDYYYSRRRRPDYDYDYEPQLDRPRRQELALIRDDDVSAARRELSRALVVRRDDRSPDKQQLQLQRVPPRRQDSADYSDEEEQYQPRRHRNDDDRSTRSSSTSGRGSRGHKSHRRARGKSCAAEADSNAPAGSSGARCWYSMKTRSNATFMERNFDSSYDGVIAGLAGAALGAMTAGRFGGDEHRVAKVAGGAALGAVMFNAGENWYRIYTEEEEEEKETEEKGRKGGRRRDRER